MINQLHTMQHKTKISLHVSWWPGIYMYIKSSSFISSKKYTYLSSFPHLNYHILPLSNHHHFQYLLTCLPWNQSKLHNTLSFSIFSCTRYWLLPPMAFHNLKSHPAFTLPFSVVFWLSLSFHQELLHVASF